ncbi:hypothetical protein PSTT_10123, partial [Puccinia striiformis]
GTTNEEKLSEQDQHQAKKLAHPQRSLHKRNNNQEDLEEDSLATDRLTKNPNLDLTQVPEPKQTTTNQPYTSFSFSSSSIHSNQSYQLHLNLKCTLVTRSKNISINFDHRLQDLVSPDEFNFDALTPYVTSSKDNNLFIYQMKSNEIFFYDSNSFANLFNYSIDSDKSFETETDCPDSTILSSLGHVLEKFFVLPHDEFSQTFKKEQRFLRSN